MSIHSQYSGQIKIKYDQNKFHNITHIRGYRSKSCLKNRPNVGSYWWPRTVSRIKSNLKNISSVNHHSNMISHWLWKVVFPRISFVKVMSERLHDINKTFLTFAYLEEVWVGSSSGSKGLAMERACIYVHHMDPCLSKRNTRGKPVWPHRPKKCHKKEKEKKKKA